MLLLELVESVCSQHERIALSCRAPHACVSTHQHASGELSVIGKALERLCMQEVWQCQFRQSAASLQRTPRVSASRPLRPQASTALWGHTAVCLEVHGVAYNRVHGAADNRVNAAADNRVHAERHNRAHVAAGHTTTNSRDSTPFPGSANQLPLWVLSHVQHHGDSSLPTGTLPVVVMVPLHATTRLFLKYQLRPSSNRRTAKQLSLCMYNRGLTISIALLRWLVGVYLHSEM